MYFIGIKIGALLANGQIIKNVDLTWIIKTWDNKHLYPQDHKCCRLVRIQKRHFH
jgi:hypothetical protein